MDGFAYLALTPAEDDVTTPSGWPDGWTFPSTSDGPWPGGWPYTPSSTYTLEVTIPDWMYAGGPMSLTVRTLLSGANTNGLDGQLIKIKADISGTTVQVKKNSADDFEDQVYFRVTNYSGAAYGFSDSIILDLDSGDDGSTVTITATVASTSTQETANDTLPVQSPAAFMFGGRPSTPTTNEETWGYSHDADSSIAGTDMSTLRERGIAEASSGTCYVIAGYIWSSGVAYQDAQTYTIQTVAWSFTTPMPTPGRFFLGSGIISGVIYCFCGEDGSGNELQDCDALTIATGAWSSKSNSPSPGRQKNCGCSIGIKVYSFGGVDVTPTILADNDEFDGTNWTSKTDIPAPARSTPTAAAVGTTGYCIGGSGSNTDIDAYSQSGNSWASKTDSSMSHTGGSAVALGGDVYAFINYASYGGGEKYDVSGDSWSTLSGVDTRSTSSMPACAA